eukprot:12341500-Alexandrium_andersonii.AAC.2
MQGCEARRNPDGALEAQGPLASNGSAPLAAGFQEQPRSKLRTVEHGAPTQEHVNVIPLERGNDEDVRVGR